MRAVYAGHEALTFPDYLDLDTGKTLYAVPGRVYDIAPASGRAADEVPAPWFVLAEGQVEVQESGWLPEAAPEPAPESEPQDVPEPGAEPEPPDEDGQSF